MTTATPARRIERLELEWGKLLEHRERVRGLDDFSRYAADPLGFIRDVLHDTPWSKQEEIAQRVLEAPRVTVQSANNTGKDWVGARLALWWLYAVRGLVLITGTTDRQVRENTMGQLRAAFNRAGDLPGDLFEGALRIGRNHENQLLAFTSSAGDASRFSGYHAPRMFVIVSEAQGVDAATYEGIYGCASGDNAKILLLGNPLDPDGPFYKACSSKDWAHVTISAFDHPNLVEQREVIPGGITQAGVDTFARGFGTDSAIYKARVLGQFSTSLLDGLVDRAWCEAAAERFESRALENQAWREWSWQAGLDVARMGEASTALAVRVGPVVRGLTTWQKLDTVQTVERLPVALAASPFRIHTHVDDSRRWFRQGEAPDHRALTLRLVVDDTGVGGGVTDQCRRAGYDVVPYLGGANPPGGPSEVYANWRAKSFLEVRQLLQFNLIALPRRDTLFEELVKARFLPLPNGKLAMEPKKDWADRLDRSPDEADALGMCLDGYYKSPGREWRTWNFRV